MNRFSQQAVALVPRINKLIAKCHRVGDLKMIRNLISNRPTREFWDFNIKGCMHPRSFKGPSANFHPIKPVQLFSCIASSKIHEFHFSFIKTLDFYFEL